MELHRNDTQTEHVLTASGAIGAAQLPELRARLLEAIDGGDFDLLLDARQVSAFDDAALPALTAGRSRAKYVRRHLVVLDGEGGAVSASLRRSGLRFRFPVHADASAAHEGLATGRADLAAHSFGRATIPEPPQPLSDTMDERSPTGSGEPRDFELQTSGQQVRYTP
jgi:anti-anti-sigma regulatory factor